MCTGDQRDPSASSRRAAAKISRSSRTSTTSHKQVSCLVRCLYARLTATRDPFFAVGSIKHWLTNTVFLVVAVRHTF
jgi:hypothetical protein